MIPATTRHIGRTVADRLWQRGHVIKGLPLVFPRFMAEKLAVECGVGPEDAADIQTAAKERWEELRAMTGRNL